MIKKLCSYPGCHKVVEAGVKYCDKHRENALLANSGERFDELRVYKLEKDQAVLDEKQEVANHRIKDLEGLSAQ